MMLPRISAKIPLFLAIVFALCLLLGTAEASVGDRLPEFKRCVQICKRENCNSNNPTSIPLHRRLLLWTCPQECDYTCQHIVTERRIARHESVTQFHGKWPFVRVLGMQEPMSVLFSLGNMYAHYNGLVQLKTQVPSSYPLRRYYVLFAYMGIVTWICSTVFHIRDFRATEQLDYFAAGAGVLYGMYYAPILVFRLDKSTPRRRSILRLWTLACCTMYACHVLYLKLWRWDYTYNMAANVVVGLVQNALWTYFSWRRYRETRRIWAIWPGCVVAWLMMAMSLELLDFPPLWGALDAHSLWHLGTILPAAVWYRFLVKDAQDDIAGGARLKR